MVELCGREDASSALNDIDFNQKPQLHISAYLVIDAIIDNAEILSAFACLGVVVVGIIQHSCGRTPNSGYYLCGSADWKNGQTSFLNSRFRVVYCKAELGKFHDTD